MRRRLNTGANGVTIKRRVHAAVQPGTWLGDMLSRGPPIPVLMALADRMARIVWACAIGLDRMATTGSMARGD